MIRSLIISSFRNLQRFRLFSFINILGLAFGMSLVFIILLFVWHEFSADKFHKNYNNIYRIEGVGGPSVTYPAGTIIRKSIPEIEKSALMYLSVINIVNPENDNTFEIHYEIADNSIFDIFTFPLISGNKNKVLSEPNSIVLSESTAKKLFGEINPVGKVVVLKSSYRQKEIQMRITGVMKDIPANSSIVTDAFASIDIALDIMGSGIETNWRNWSFQLFVLMNENSNPKKILPKINRVLQSAMVESGWISQKELDEGIKEGDYKFSYTPLSDLYFLNSDTWLNHGNKKLTQLYLLIAIIVLIIAIVNYINLSTAIASQRAKEIGFRKLLGADKKNLLAQIFFETLAITLIALLFSLFLMELFLPAILKILPKEAHLQSIYSPQILLIFLGSSILIAFVSSIYPAVFLFRFRPMDVIRPSGSINLKSGNIRKILILFQFIVSAILIFSVMIIQKQLNFLKDYDPGFKQENIISMNATYDVLKNTKVFKNSIMNIPGVVNVSFSGNIPANIGSYWGGTMSNGYEYMFAKIRVDTNFMNIFGLELIKGKTFKEALMQGDDKIIIINKEAERKINAEDVLNIKTDGEYKIVGVTRDFNFLTAKKSVGPLMLVYTQKPLWGKVIIELNGKNKETIDKISDVWESFTSVPFDFSYVKDDYDRATGNEERIARVITGFTVISLVLSFLGIFGLVTFMLNRKIKEMGIRKVLGANNSRLFALVSAEFLKLVIIANIIAVPIAWYFITNWLDNFPNRIGIPWWMFFVSLALLLILSISIIFIKSSLIFKSKTVEALKYE